MAAPLPLQLFKGEIAGGFIVLSLLPVVRNHTALAFRSNVSPQEALWDDENNARRRAGASLGPDPPPAPTGDKVFFCDVELEDCSYANGDALPCGHWFSKSAWRRLVSARLSDASTADIILESRCPQDGCPERLRKRMFDAYDVDVPSAPLSSDAVACGGVASPCTAAEVASACEARAIAASPQAVIAAPQLSRYDQHCVRAYIASHPTLACCKAPGCVLVVPRPPGGGPTLCPAGHRFCASRKCTVGESHM
jgi:hypothetical protein